MYKYLDANRELSKDALTLLRRPLDASVPDEVMVSLESDYAKPKSLRDLPAAMADVPIVAANTLEKRRAVYDPSPELPKFIIATHLVPIGLPASLYESSLGYLQEKITEISYKYPQFRTELGRGGILDLDIHGKPLSLLHLGLSDGRSKSQVEIARETIENALSIYERNMDNTLAIRQDAFLGDGKLDFSGTAPEQSRIAGYIYQHGPSTPEQVYEAVKNETSRDSFYKWWNDLHNHGGIYEKRPGVFDIIPHYRE